MRIRILPGDYAICRLAPTEGLPNWVTPPSAEFVSVTRTAEELSVVASAALVPSDLPATRGWRVIQLVGPVPLEAVGVLARLTRVLSQEEVNIFAISTYDTDYILTPADKLERAVAALGTAGYALTA
jgi:hypothetical protein